MLMNANNQFLHLHKTKTMNTHRSWHVLLLAGAIFSLTSCNNNTGQKTEQTSTDSATTATTTTTSPASTRASSIVSTPQNMLVIRHRVSNYSKWKMNYDAHDTARTSHGVHNYVIGRGLMDSNMVVVALKIDDSARAMAFAKSPDLKQAMSRGGVMGNPDVTWYTAIWQDTSTISTRLRSSVSFTVKDWNTWLTSFKQGDEERTSNGVAVRSYGHDMNNPNKVRVVTALVDSAKATAYFKSDMLKKRMDSSGVIGKPERFIYRIIERY